MCITFLYVNPGDTSIKYKLILINNRDEDYARLTQKATLTKVDTGIQSIFGIDLAGAVRGTWLGLSVDDKTIKIGNLANVTGEVHLSGSKGRGPIVTEFINSDESIESYNKKLNEMSQDFGSFNFLSIEIKKDETKSFYVSNIPQTIEEVPLGFVGLGNSPLSQPFKKVSEGLKEFEDILNKFKDDDKKELSKALLNFLKSDKKHFPDEVLKKRRNLTAEKFSSIHVDFSEVNYGTRTRTIILIDDDKVEYIEQTMTSLDPNGDWETTHLTIPHKL